MALRILYVDDEADLREIAAMALSLDPEFEVRTAASGAEGVEAAADWSPALVMLDVMMPELDGPATLAALRGRADTADIPIAFITARTQPRDVERLTALGACAVIAKPFNPMQLAADVRALIDS